MAYVPRDDRYARMAYRACGASGLLELTPEDLAEVDRYADEEGINLWARSAEIEDA